MVILLPAWKSIEPPVALSDEISIGKLIVIEPFLVVTVRFPALDVPVAEIGVGGESNLKAVLVP